MQLVGLGLDGTREKAELMPSGTITVINREGNNHLAVVAVHLKECSLGVFFLMSWMSRKIGLLKT